MAITKEGYQLIIYKYQATGNDDYLTEMANYLERTLKQLTYSNLKRVSGYGYTYGDVYTVVLETLWRVMEQFDGSKGSDFLAYFQQMVHWKVNDELIEKKGSRGDPKYADALTLDIDATDEDLESADDIMFNNQDNQEMSYTDEQILEVEYALTYIPLYKEYVSMANKLGGQARVALLNDKAILSTIFQAVEDNQSSAKDINERLYNKYPNISKLAIRQRKMVATKRFGKFLKEKSL